MKQGSQHREPFSAQRAPPVFGAEPSDDLRYLIINRLYQPPLRALTVAMIDLHGGRPRRGEAVVKPKTQVLPADEWRGYATAATAVGLQHARVKHGRVESDERDGGAIRTVTACAKSTATISGRGHSPADLPVYLSWR